MDNKNMLSDEQLENVNGGMYESRDIITRVISIISEQLDIDRNMIQPHSVLNMDLGADFYDVIDIIQALELSFDVRLDEGLISVSSTVEDIVHLIEIAAR